MAEEIKKVNLEELNKIAGGADGKVGMNPDGPWKKVMNLKTGWLALRTAPIYDYSNEIGQLQNDDEVQITGNGSGLSDDGQSYVWVYSKRLNQSGWVNDKFIG